MTDKQYRCQNGDLIELGKEYKDVYDDNPVKVVGFNNGRIVVYCSGDANYQPYVAYSADEFQCLKQEPEADGWIRQIRDKQPVDDGVLVDVEYQNGGAFRGLSQFISWEDATTYRIVEDKQELEETFMQLFKSEYDFRHYHIEAQKVIEAIGVTIDKYLQKKGI